MGTQLVLRLFCGEQVYKILLEFIVDIYLQIKFQMFSIILHHRMKHSNLGTIEKAFGTLIILKAL